MTNPIKLNDDAQRDRSAMWEIIKLMKHVPVTAPGAAFYSAFRNVPSEEKLDMGKELYVMICETPERVNNRNVTGMTPLSLAVANGFDNTVLAFLNWKERIHADTIKNALHAALDCKVPNEEICKQLYEILQPSAAFDFDIYCNTLGVACKLSMESVFDKLIEDVRFKHAVLNPVYRSSTPLHLAVLGNSFSICEKLLKNGASYGVNILAGPNLESPLTIAVKNKNVEICELLIRNGAKTSIPGQSSYQILVEAVKTGSVPVCKILLDSGADPKMFGQRRGSGCGFSNEETWSPLSEAARLGHVEICELLMSYGAPVNVSPKSKNFEPLDYACLNGHLDVCRLLIEKGKADYKRTSGTSGWNLLHLAGKSGNLDVCKYLVNLDKTLVNSTSKDGATPLWLSVMHNEVENVNFLLENGAAETINDSIKLSSADTPLSVAVEHNLLAMVQVLLKHGAKVNYFLDYRPPLQFAKTFDMVKLLLENGADPNQVSKYGTTPLKNFVVNYKRFDICKLLIEYGADVDLRDKDGKDVSDYIQSPDLKEWQKLVEEATAARSEEVRAKMEKRDDIGTFQAAREMNNFLAGRLPSSQTPSVI